jgi:hypothetical protein
MLNARFCALEVQRETERLQGLGYDLKVSAEALEFIVREGFISSWGPAAAQDRGA